MNYCWYLLYLYVNISVFLYTNLLPISFYDKINQNKIFNTFLIVITVLKYSGDQIEILHDNI